jgi:hypothetical protein
MLYIWEDNINLREVAIESNMEYIACPPTWFNSEAFLQMNLNKFKEIIQRVDNKSLAEVKDPIADLSDSCKTVIVVYHYYSGYIVSLDFMESSVGGAMIAELSSIRDVRVATSHAIGGLPSNTLAYIMNDAADLHKDINQCIAEAFKPKDRSLHCKSSAGSYRTELEFAKNIQVVRGDSREMKMLYDFVKHEGDIPLAGTDLLLSNYESYKFRNDHYRCNNVYITNPYDTELTNPAVAMEIMTVAITGGYFLISTLKPMHNYFTEMIDTRGKLRLVGDTFKLTTHNEASETNLFGK